jgi:type I restriction enzyme S subunit
MNTTPLYEEGLVLFPKRGAAIFTNKVKISSIRCIFDTNLMGLQINNKAYKRFIAYYLISRRLDDIADTSTIPQINNKHIYPLYFPFPSLKEQQYIASFLDSETKKIDTLIEKVKLSIEKLREYRTALISAAVTGKIDVREEIA